MVGVGEKGGGVDLMLEKLAEYYELDIATQSSILTTVIYFAVYLAVAITVGIMVISGYMSYFGIINSLINEA
jgi:type IV pilus assembly protein PilC